MTSWKTEEGEQRIVDRETRKEVVQNREDAMLEMERVDSARIAVQL
jgi:hypothetical protein